MHAFNMEMFCCLFCRLANIFFAVTLTAFLSDFTFVIRQISENTHQGKPGGSEFSSKKNPHGAWYKRWLFQLLRQCLPTHWGTQNPCTPKSKIKARFKFPSYRNFNASYFDFKPNKYEPTFWRWIDPPQKKTPSSYFIQFKSCFNGALIFHVTGI